MIDMKLSIPSDKHRDQQHTITRVVIITFNFISFEKYVIAVSTISLTGLYVKLFAIILTDYAFSLDISLKCVVLTKLDLVVMFSGL